MKRFLCLMLVLSMIGLGPVLSGMAEGLELEFIDLDETEGDETEVELSEEETGEADIPYEAISYGDTGDEVLEMQTKLTELGYYSGNLSGEFHESTRAALKAFQQDYQLPVTGKGDSTTLEVLYEAAYRPLKYGDKGTDVKDLQQRLMLLGYYTGKISGNYLNGTQAAISAFQTRNSLEATGIADQTTQRLLYSDAALSRTDATSVTPTPPPANDSFLVDEDAVQEVVSTPQKVIPFDKTLKRGSKGEQVKTLQTRLTELGYYTGPISGNFQGKTNAAVKTLQKQNALTQDGVVNEQLWNLIFYDTALVLPQHTAKPTPVPTPVPFAITVDVNNQVTTVYGRDENGQYTVVVREMLCSTGLKGTPSDPGDWVLNGRRARWCYFPKWGGHAQYWTRINSNIAFHSVIYTETNSSALKVSSYKVLGRRASHGCIRLTVADAKWIYDNVGKGTVVSIVENLPSDPELVASLQLPKLNYYTMLPETTPQPTAEPSYSSMSEPPFELKKLQQKNSGEEVYWLQRRLKDLGYYRGKCSGTFLKGTANAVKAFQRANKIYPSGVADVRTLKALYAIPVPTPTPAPLELEEVYLSEGE